MKKTQAALEFLLTYGWTLLAIIMLGGLVWLYVGGNECGRLSSGFFGQQINLQDWTVHDDGSITLVLNNKALATIVITEIVGEAGTDDIDDVTLLPKTPPVIITTIPDVAKRGNQGNCYRDSVLVMKYSVSTGSRHVIAGRLSGLYEKQLPPPPPPIPQCNDGIDNDGDTFIDLNDPGCIDADDPSELGIVQCDDGIDNNDADNLRDYPNDPGCSSPSDNDEIDGECDNNLDDDGDTHVDLSDSECTSYSDNDESPKDSCTDTDGGIDDSVQGTVSGDDNDIPFSNTDSCIDINTLTEYYCGSKTQDYDPLSIQINCGAGKECLNGACSTISIPPADIIAFSTIKGQTTKYLGVTEGAQFKINDIINSGAKSYRIWYGMDRIMNSGGPGGTYVDYVPPYGQPTIAQIKLLLNSWPMSKPQLEDTIKILIINAYMTADMWGQGVSFDQQISQLNANGITPVITLRNRNKDGDPIGSPRVPFNTNDWNEYWYYVFAVAYWTNVYANGGSGYNVERWEVHNEPQFDFGGTPANYTEFVNYTNDAIKAANNLKGVNTKLMAAVDVADPGGYDYLIRTLDDQGAIYNYNLAYVDYHNYMEWKDDKVAADEVYNIMKTRNKVKPMWISEWGTYDGVPAWYTDYSMAMKVVNTTFRLSQLHKYNSDEYVEGSNLFIMDGPWGFGPDPFQGIVQNNIKTPTYKGFHLQTRCIQGGKNFYELSKDDNFVLVAKEGNNVYINSVEYGKTFTINVSKVLGKETGTYDVYIFNQTHQDVKIVTDKSFNEAIGNYINLTVPSNGAICAIVT